jgi:hypothetical protein
MFGWKKTKEKEKEKSLTTLKQELAIIVDNVFAIDPTASITIRQVVFDAKYKADVTAEETKTPSELVEEFNAQADKGDNKFLRHYFYRVLRRNHDPIIRRLKYRLKRHY